MTIVDEIVECFNESKEIPNSRLSEITIIKFMLGEGLAEKYSKTNLREYKKSQKSWDTEDIKTFVFESDTNWTLLDIKDTRLKKLIKVSLVHSVLMEKLLKLAEKYFLLETPFTASSFKRLCAHAFFNTAYPEKLFKPYRHARLTNYVVWEDAENKISNMLLSNSIVYIYGDAASGKTLLTKKVLKDYFYNSSDIYFAKMDDPDLRKSIQKLPFIDGTHDLDTVLSYLNAKSENSALIIKRPFITPEDYEFINEHFFTLKMKFVILTQTDLTPKTPFCISVKNRPDENLKAIYIKARKCNDLTTDELLVLLDIVSKNPYVLSLVAKVLRHFQNDTEYNLLKERFLDKTEWIWNLSEQPTLNEGYHGKGKKSKQTLPRLISYILDCYGCAQKYSPLSIWAKTPIPQQLLIDFSDFTEEDVEIALQRGLLEYIDETTKVVAMPSIVADSIWEQYPQPYTEYKSKLQEFLKYIKSGTQITLPYKTLYPIVRTLVQRFHFQVYKITGNIDPHENPEFVEWNHLLIELIHHLTELGNYEIAEEFVPYILFCKQKRYKEKWKVNDAAIQSEQLIRSSLRFKAKFMSEGLSLTVLSDLQSIFKKASALINQSNQIDPDDAVAIYFAVTTFQSFVDYEIRLDKVCLQNQTLGTDTFYTTYPRHIDNHLDLLIDLLGALFSKTPLLNLKQSYHYYTLTKAFRNNISGASTITNDIISEHNAALTELMPASKELLLKAGCQNLYYTLTRILTTKAYSLNFLENTILEWAETEFNYLSSHLLGRVYSFDTIWSLCLCMCQLVPYRDHVKRETRQHLRDTWEKMLYLAGEQITLSASDRDILLRVISQLSKQLS